MFFTAHNFNFQQMNHHLIISDCIRLKHKNIVQLVETFEDRNKVYLVMELYVE